MNHIVLHEPLIPQNTGNIMRTCVATGARLHLIKPLGFSLDDKHMRRPALDYMRDLELDVHESFEAFIKHRRGRFYYITRYAERTHDGFDYTGDEDVFFIFGKETTGLPKALLKDNLETCVRIPMTDKTRILNLSNTVAVVLYEALRQQGYPNLHTHEPDTLKGKDFLKNHNGSD